MFLAISAYKKYSARQKQKESIEIKDNVDLPTSSPSYYPVNDPENQARHPSSSTSHLANSTSVNMVSDSSQDIRLQKKEARRAEEKKLQKVVRRRQIIRVGTLVIIDIALPLALYFALRNHISVIVALVISGIPPLLNVIYTFIRKRQIDALGCLFVFSFILSGVISLVTGNARIALLRESAITGLLCVLFFITCIPIKTPWFVNRPLIFLISQELYAEFPPFTWVDESGVEHQQPRIPWFWNYYKPFKVYCYVFSLVWSVGLGGEFLSRVIMVECTTLTIDQIVKYGTIIVATVSSVLGVATAVSTAILRKKSNVFVDRWMEENDHVNLLEIRDAENKDMQ